ncbi:MAG TPA: hypothetical protein VJL31_16015, partial [Gemmatimonadales bacterium]|nr:hypothetical protein [Gemmatimonadales bacterium]
MDGPAQDSSAWARRGRLAAVALLSVAVSTCDVGKLVETPTPSTVSVAPVQLADSAPLGSAAPRVTSIQVSSAGPGSPSWSLSRAQGSAWLVVSPTSGGVPANLDISLVPVGLPLGVHHDTLIVSVSGATTAATRVPVRFTIHPCRFSSIQPDTSVQGTIDDSDCGAPHRSGRFAKVFRFDGAANDSISARVSSGAFGAYVLLDSVPLGDALAQSGSCAGGAACIRYARLPRTGTYALAATSVDSGRTGEFTMEVTPPRPPAAPSGLAQFRRDSTTAVAGGGTVPDTLVILRGVAADPDLGDSLRLEVEVQLGAEPFTGTPTDSSDRVAAGEAALVPLSGLRDDRSYRWRVRARDQTGRASPWVEFDGATGTSPDFVTAVPEPPAAPSALAQLKADAATAIATGATTDERSVVLRATVTDPDPGDALRLEVEVRPLGAAFTGTPTASSPAVASLETATVAIAGLADDTTYHWQARVSDASELTSAWVPFGGNQETEADFRVAVPATHLAFLVQPADALPGGTINAVEVEAREASGQRDLSFAGSVTVAIASGTGTAGAALAGTLTVPLQSGVSRFTDLSIAQPGTGYRLAATAAGLTPATSAAFSIAAGPAAELVFVQQPTNTASGEPITPALEVTARDADGNVATSFTGTITLAFAPGTGTSGASLSGTVAVAASAGIATFSDLSIDLVGTAYRLTASASGLPAVTSGTFDVFASDAVAVEFVVGPRNIVAGAAIQPSVQVRAVDGFGNPATGFAGNITLAISAGSG